MGVLLLINNNYPQQFGHFLYIKVTTTKAVKSTEREREMKQYIETNTGGEKERETKTQV